MDIGLLTIFIILFITVIQTHYRFKHLDSRLKQLLWRVESLEKERTT